MSFLINFLCYLIIIMFTKLFIYIKLNFSYKKVLYVNKITFGTVILN